MAERSAYDILNLLGNAQRENVQLVGGLIDSGFRNATAGVKNASDIISSTVSAGLEYKKTVVDEWYKGETLKQRDREAEALLNYRTAELALREREIDARVDYYENVKRTEVEATIRAKRSSDAIKVLDSKRRTLVDRARIEEGLQTKDINELQNLQKFLTENQDSLPNGYADFKKYADRIKSLEEGINQRKLKIADFGTDLGNLDYSIVGLRNGTLDPENVEEEFRKPIPGDPRPSSDSNPVDNFQGAESSLGGFNKEQPVGWNNPVQVNPVHANPDANKFPTDIAFGIINKLANEGAPPAKISNFIKTQTNAETQKNFEDQRNVMKKMYFDDRFNEIKNIPSRLAINETEFKKDYLKVGGDPRELDSISLAVKGELEKISQITKPEERDKAINDLRTRLFPETKVPSNISANGRANPNNVFSLDGTISKNQLSSPRTAQEREIIEGSRSDRDAVMNVIGGVVNDGKGKTKRIDGYALMKNEDGEVELTPEAKNRINGLTTNQMLELGLFSPETEKMLKLIRGDINKDDPDFFEESTATQMNLSPEQMDKVNDEIFAIKSSLINSPRQRKRAIKALIDFEKFSK